jgi:hypothetical protein
MEAELGPFHDGEAGGADGKRAVGGEFKGGASNGGTSPD